MSFQDHSGCWQNSVPFGCRTEPVYLQVDSCGPVLLLEVVHIHSQVFHVLSLATGSQSPLTQESVISLTPAREISVLLIYHYSGPTWIIQDNLPILRSETSENICKVPFAMEHNIFRDFRV